MITQPPFRLATRDSITQATIVPDDTVVDPVAVAAPVATEAETTTDDLASDLALSEPSDRTPASASDPSDDVDPSSSSLELETGTLEPKITQPISHNWRRPEAVDGQAVDGMSGPLAGLNAHAPLSAAGGCIRCKAHRNELDEHIERRAAEMHDILDVGDAAGIRHDYLTACNEIKY